MKKLLIASLLCTFVALLQVGAYDLPKEILLALEEGNVKNISKYLGSSVELIFTDTQGVYAKAQAEQILKNFFNDNGSEGFKYRHLHTTNNDNHLGELRTSKGIVYRVFIRIKKGVIHQMKIENVD